MPPTTAMLTRSLTKLALVGCAAAAAALALAADQSFACPASIAVTQTPGPAPEKWGAIDRGRGKYLLVGAGLTDGHPKDKGDLKPDNGDEKPRKGRPLVSKYTFGASYPDGIYLECSYRDTSVTAFLKLPAGLKACEIAYASKPEAPSPIQSIKCR